MVAKLVTYCSTPYPEVCRDCLLKDYCIPDECDKLNHRTNAVGLVHPVTPTYAQMAHKVVTTITSRNRGAVESLSVNVHPNGFNIKYKTKARTL